MKEIYFLLVVVLCVEVSQATLPQQFLGVWMGIPEYNELGPWGVNLNFSIQEIDNDGSRWLMRDTFPESVGVSGFQDFYVDETEQSMHYCGCIRHFYNFPAPTSRAYYDITTQSDTKMVFCLRNTDKKCDTTWELTLTDNNTLHSEYKFPSPVKHLDVTLKRFSSLPILSEQEKENIQKSSNCHSEYNSCLRSSNEEGKGGEGEISGVKESGCPYAGLKKVFNGFWKNEKKKEKTSKIHPRTGQPMKNCYIFNEVVNYQFAWTFDEVRQVIDVMITLPVTDDTTYAAFGIGNDWTFPDAPGMSNADIVMGWADNGCVVSLYSDQETGTPALSTNQTILNSFSSFNDGLLTVSYTRPFITGHHDIRRGDVDQVIWSTGSVKPAQNGECEAASWHYHSNLRGRRMIQWSNGPSTFDENMAC